MTTTTGIKRLSSQTRDLTPDLATEFNQMPASVTERDLDPKRLKFLRETILHGVALPFMWARAKVLTDGTVYRVNGHHSSNVLAAMNGTMPEGLVAHIDDFEVDDVLRLAGLFRQFDSRRSARSVGDIAGAYQMIMPPLQSVSRLAGRRAIEGAAWHEHRVFGADVPKGDDMFVLFHDPRYHSFVQFVGRVYSKKTPEFTTPVIGAMFATFDRAPEHAEAFWLAVSRQGGGNDDKHPATVLDAWLLSAKDAKDKPSAMEIFRACVVAWNASRNNRSLDRIGRYDAKKGFPDIE